MHSGVSSDLPSSYSLAEAKKEGPRLRPFLSLTTCAILLVDQRSGSFHLSNDRGSSGLFANAWFTRARAEVALQQNIRSQSTMTPLTNQRKLFGARFPTLIGPWRHAYPKVLPRGSKDLGLALIASSYCSVRIIFLARSGRLCLQTGVGVVDAGSLQQLDPSRHGDQNSVE